MKNRKYAHYINLILIGGFLTLCWFTVNHIRNSGFGIAFFKSATGLVLFTGIFLFVNIRYWIGLSITWLSFVLLILVKVCFKDYSLNVSFITQLGVCLYFTFQQIYFDRIRK